MKLFLKVLLINLCVVTASQASTSKDYAFSECMSDACQEKFIAYKKLIKDGDAQVQMILATMYYTGYGVKRDAKLSLHYFKRASKQSEPFAQHRAGLLYLFDKDIEQNIPKGINFLKKAARNGSVGAAQRLADIYIHGDLVPENMAFAEKWLTIASKSDANSQHRLGLLYESGALGEKQLAKAVTLYKKAAHKSKAAKDRLVSMGIIEKLMFASSTDENVEHITVNAPDLIEVLDLTLANIKTYSAMNRFDLEDFYYYQGQ